MLYSTVIKHLLLACLLMISKDFTSLAIFIHAPLNVLVPPSSSEDFAVFYCQHDTADIVSWEVNGTSLSYFDVNVTIYTHLLPYGAPLHKLKMPIDRENNLMAVVCLALFLDGSATQTTEPAFLILQDGARPIPKGFVETPILEYNMAEELILATGENAGFTCQHCQSDNIRWRLNGTLIENKTLDVVIAYTFQSHCGILFSLVITKIENYNKTKIQCEAEVDTSFILTEPVLLLVQGALDPVYNLRRNSIEPDLDMFTWERPFSLNVTNADPDIIYCVHIFPISCLHDQATSLINDCSVTDTNYTLPKHLNRGSLYQVEVLPRINLDIAMNGTQKATYKDKFVHIIIENKYIMLYTTDNDRGSIIFEITLTFQLQNVTNGVKPLANDISLQLMSIDSNVRTSRECLTMLDIRKLNTRNETVFNYTEALNCSAIEIRRLYMVTLFVHRSGCSISDAFELSTHLIDNINISLTFQPGEILISGNFIIPSGTEGDIGFLAVVYTNLDDDPHLHYGIAIRQTAKLHAVAFVSRLMEYEYRVSVFSLQDNGLPLNRSVGTACKISAGNHSVNNLNFSAHGSTNITATATSENNCLRLTCKFLEDSASQCVVVVSEKDQITSEYGLLTIKVYNFIREGDTASGCLPNVNTDNHTIDVFTLHGNILIGPPTSINSAIDSPSPVDMKQQLIIGIYTVVAGVITLSLAIIFIQVGLKIARRYSSINSYRKLQNKDLEKPKEKPSIIIGTMISQEEYESADNDSGEDFETII